MSNTPKPSHARVPTARVPTDVADCTCANLRKAARAVTQAYDSALQPSGLKATQFTVLATLSRREDVPVSRLAEALVMDRTTLTRNLKPLMAKGLIDVGSDDDRRIRRLSLTDAGRRKLADALPHWQAAQVRLARKLGQEPWSDLLDNLSAAVTAVQGR